MGRVAWINGSVLTMDRARPRASALVVRGDEIEYVGSDGEAIARSGEGAELRDLGGRAVVPGFNDNHVHAVHMGDHALAPDLGGLSAQEIVGLLRERFPDPAPGEAIRAFNWDYPACPDPRKELLDAAFPRNPVVLNQYGGHGQWLNGAALRAIGVDRGRGFGRGPRGDPRRGTVLRDADGEPTGVVRDLGDTRLSRMRNRAIYYDDRQRERRMDIALEAFAALGVTSVQDNAWFYPELLGLRRRYARGGLTARFSCWPRGSRPRARAAMDAAFALGVGVPDWIRPGPVKYFLDGTFSTRNACLSEPFAGAEAEPLCPEPAAPLAELSFLARRGRQGAFHAIGDRGIEIFLDAYELVLARRPGLRELRVRIEHAQLIRPADIERITRLDVLVAAQPSALGTPGKDEALLGRERALRAYPYRSLIDAGARLSFGSDIPGEDRCDPLRSISMAANREGPERISVEEALRCYTEGSAYAEFAEGRKGVLAPGMLADFAVLSRDIAAIPAAEVAGVVVEETVVGGRTVYRRGVAERGAPLEGWGAGRGNL
jgi:predicted amidohydrolase YtcJ